MRPIACTLSGTDYRARLAAIADLNRTSLKSANRSGLGLLLTYDRDALPAVEQMVEQEKACCGFLSFDIVSDRKAVKLAITAPEEAREAIDEIFAPFLATASSTCTCCGTAA